MKKIFISLLSMLIIPTFCFASNYKIQNEIEYKRKIENRINKEFPKIKRKINKEYAEAQKTYQKFLKDKNKKENIDEYIFIIEDYQRGIETSDVLFIYSLILITNDYQNIKINVPATDDAETLLEFIKPYFISNNINYSKINELKIYKIDKINKINFLLNDKLYHFKYF